MHSTWQRLCIWLAATLSIVASGGVNSHFTARAAAPYQLATVGPDLVTTPTTLPTQTPLPAPSPTDLSTADSDPDLTPDLTHGRDQTRYYTIKAGDTLWTVALDLGLDVDDVGCLIAPDFQPRQPLVIGDVLEAPPDLVCHTVGADETLLAITKQYAISPEEIVDVAWNRLAAPDAPLAPQTYLRIPQTFSAGAVLSNELIWMLGQPADGASQLAIAVGGPEPAVEAIAMPADWIYGSGDFAWPTYGWLSQGFHVRHRAIDIAAPIGTLVTAADRGVVVRAGWNEQGYGLFIVIDHNIDYLSLYAHLSEILVKEGQIVAKGGVVGKVGSTGNSTGPHLHFEIRDFGHLSDPIELLLR